MGEKVPFFLQIFLPVKHFFTGTSGKNIFTGKPGLPEQGFTTLPAPLSPGGKEGKLDNFLKPVWFHPESEYAIFVKPFWFHQKSEYAINQCRRRFFGLMAPP